MVMRQCGPVNQASRHARGIPLFKETFWRGGGHLVLILLLTAKRKNTANTSRCNAHQPTHTPTTQFRITNFPHGQPASKALEEWLREWKCTWFNWMPKYTLYSSYMLCEHTVYTEEPLNHHEVIFILSCFPSLLVPYLFLSSQVHVLIIHIATGVCIRVSTVKFKKRVLGSLPRMHADNDFS